MTFSIEKGRGLLQATGCYQTDFLLLFVDTHFLIYILYVEIAFLSSTSEK